MPTTSRTASVVAKTVPATSTATFLAGRFRPMEVPDVARLEGALVAALVAAAGFFFAVTRLADVFLATSLLLEDFLTGAFTAGAFTAGTLVGALVAGVFRAGVFRAGTFLAGTLLATDC